MNETHATLSFLFRQKESRINKMHVSDLYISVGGALTGIIIKDGDHPTRSGERVLHSCSGSSSSSSISSCSSSGSLAGICRLNRDGLSVWCEILVMKRNNTYSCNSNEPISMQLIPSAWWTLSASCYAEEKSRHSSNVGENKKSKQISRD